LNIAFFLTPKAMITCLYEDFTVRQGLEKLRQHGFTAVPVISRSGRYVGTVTEGDFLWCLVDTGVGLRGIEKLPLSSIVRPNYIPAVRITESMTHVIDQSRYQNFVPVIDDNDNLVGIVKRSDIIAYLQTKRLPGAGQEQTAP